MKKALITGVTGQDGSYLAEYLLDLGYQVCGMYRRSSTDTLERIEKIKGNPLFLLKYGDLTDYSSLVSLISEFKPDEVYNLAAQSDVGASFSLPLQTGLVTGLGVTALLEAIRKTKNDVRFYQASSSELFGKVVETPQTEHTLFRPRSPYGVAKLYGYWITRNYREAYSMYACNGILFNHESPRRGDKFVTKKIVKQMVEVWKRERKHIELGNLDSKRDWGFAGDYVEAMHLMLQQDKPDDYVIATGETHSVREFVEETAGYLDWTISWKGEGIEEEGFNQFGKLVVKVNPEFYRPAEVDLLLGDASKAEKELGWKPRTTFSGLVKMMLEEEIDG
jgi:GDPmannose 4,6-dehydratase